MPDNDVIRHPFADAVKVLEQGIATLEQENASLRAVLESAVDAWPEPESDDEVNGGDLVEWFGEWLVGARAALAERGSK